MEPATLPYYTSAEQCREAFPTAPVLNEKFPELRHVFWTAGDMDDLKGVFERVGTPLEARQVVEFIFRRYRVGFYVSLIENGGGKGANSGKEKGANSGKGADSGIDLWFVPFENVEYVNPYAKYLRLDPRVNVAEMKRDAEKRGVKMEFELNPEKWKLANFLVRMETWESLKEGADERSYSFYYYETYCLFRNLADWLREQKKGWGRRDMVVSYRDQMIVMANSCDPMVHVVGSSSVPLPEQPFPSKELMKHCPVFSFSSSGKYLDRPAVTPDDIRQVFRLYVPPECKPMFQVPGKEVPWDLREPRAVFRGSATGAGMDARTNQRLRLASLGKRLSKWIDAGVVSIPGRFKKVQWEKWVRRNPRFDQLAGVYRVSYMSSDEQNRFRYQIYVEGNVAAYRLGKMLGSGSLILKVDSEFTMWVDRFIKPWVHYVPVRADLRDLVERIEWCQRNDEKAQEIAKAARKVYDTIMTPAFMAHYMARELNLVD